jgi:predicted GTPase
MKKLPRVAIVGFPNVGKSTLFNRILGKRKALVHSLPGMTRDSVASPCSLGGKRFMLVDTGGLFGVKDEPLSTEVRKKAWTEAVSADFVLFVLDGKRDISPAEEELYLSLVKLDKLRPRRNCIFPWSSLTSRCSSWSTKSTPPSRRGELRSTTGWARRTSI